MKMRLRFNQSLRALYRSINMFHFNISQMSDHSQIFHNKSKAISLVSVNG